MADSRKTIKSDITYLYDKLKPEDIKEIEALGYTSKQALDECFHNSKHCLTIVHNDKPIGIFGVSEDKTDKNTGKHIGKLGLLTTSAIKDIKYQLIKEAKKHLSKILQNYKCVYNIVSQDNISSIKFLQCLDFKFLSTCTINNHYYITFFKEL